MTAWNDKVTVKKGNIGEAIVREYLIKQGNVIYAPESNGAHPFDKLCASRDKKSIFIAEVKSKPARVYYPDTGIDIRHYEDYLFIQEKHNLDVFIFFVDEDRKTVYGNFLRKLIEPKIIKVSLIDKIYPLRQNGIIYFPLVNMITIGEITAEQSNQLKELSTRNTAYSEIVENSITQTDPNDELSKYDWFEEVTP